MAGEKMCNINVKLLPIKLHYFFFYGAMGGVIPYMPVLAKGLGINATAVGLVFTVLPFCVFFSKPLFGYLTDHFRNIKLIIFILISVTSVTYLAVTFIPALQETVWTDVQLDCTSNNKWLSVIPQDYDKKCLHETLGQGTNCELNYHLCDNNTSVTLFGKTTVEDINNSSQHLINTSIVLKFEPNDNFTCECVNNSSVFRCPRPDVNACFITNDKSVYKSFQFWLFTLLVVISGTGAATVFCLSDAACYEVLGDQPEHFGRQRMYATISWGCATFLAGFLNDLATGGSDFSTYTPGFYLMLALVGIDLILLLKIKLTKANFSIDICKDVGKIFSSCETVAFAVAVYIVGGLTGLIWNYQFWFLQDLGANQTLLGLTVAVQCLVAEVPFFFFAGWFIKKFGYFYCLTGSFVAFAMRLGLYYVLEDPWMVLPIEVLHGVTFAIFYASMTGYASNNAPPGTEATMMGILGGLFEGLGVATGSLLGGVGFDKLGGRDTFLVACIISLICVPTFALTHILIKNLVPKHDYAISKEKPNYGSNSSKL